MSVHCASCHDVLTRRNRRRRALDRRRLRSWVGVAVVLASAMGAGSVLFDGDDQRAAALGPEFGPSKNIWIARDTLLSLPASGPAWDRVAADAGRAWGTADIADQDSNHDVLTLAGAFYAVRTNDSAMRSKTVAAIESAIGTESGGRTLALARNLTGYVLAADLIGYESAQFTSWLRAVRTANLDGRTLISTHEDRPNNWGTHAGAARIAANRYLGDDADLSRAVAVFRGYLGDRGAYAGFSFGAPDWQADPSNPVPINPRGATKNGINVDGAIVDDVRRCECPVSSPAPKENYQWEAMQGIVAQAELLDNAGYDDVWSWSDAAIRRAVAFLYEQADYPAEGDDSFLTFLIDANLGTGYALGVSDHSGKSIGYTSWTHDSDPAPTVVVTLPPATTPPPTTSVAPVTTTTAPVPTTAPAPATTTVAPAPTPTTTAPPPEPAPTVPTIPPVTTTAPTAPTFASHASSATVVAGSAAGSYQDTWTRGDGAHRIVELESNGRSSRRHDRAELRWTVPAIEGDQLLDLTLTVGPDSGDDDAGFFVEWSANGTDWTSIALVASETTLTLTAELGAPTSDVHVRVVDSDRSRGERLPDWVSVDYLSIRRAPVLHNGVLVGSAGG